MSDSYHICRDCYFAKKTCCTTPNPIFIGILEAIKIHQETGLKYSDFLVYAEFAHEQFLEAFDELLPSKKSIMLRHKPDHGCIFLSEKGCQIPQVKPFICRVFPVWYDQEYYKETGMMDLFVESDRDCELAAKIDSYQNLDEGCQLYIGNSEAELKSIFLHAFEHYEMARAFEYLFETRTLDDAFAEIEKILKEKGKI
jgi:Fe-S-cluster containining protein